MPVKTRALAVSERVFRWILRAYPRAHRAEYEEPMAQLFRDLGRRAWDRGGWIALIGAWGFILKDTVRSLRREHHARGRTRMEHVRKGFGGSLKRDLTSVQGLARTFLWCGAPLVLIGSVLKLTSLPLTEGQLVIGLLCSCAVALQLTVLGVLVPPDRAPASEGRTPV